MFSGCLIGFGSPELTKRYLRKNPHNLLLNISVHCPQ